jgi:hypothetical protein
MHCQIDDVHEQTDPCVGLEQSYVTHLGTID